MQPSVPSWYLNARETDRQFLKALIDERWRLQGSLDQTLGNLQQDINAFAEPLLKQALKDECGSEFDVHATRLHLYVPAPLSFGIDTGASHLRHSTLLEAALHNFEAPETHEDAFRTGSGLYTTDAQGGLRQERVTVGEFAALCRKLDLGSRYQSHLESVLAPAERSARETLARQALASEKAAFSVAALTALLKGDITSYGYGRLLHIRDDRQGIDFYGRPLLSHRLSLMGFRLTGVVLFSALADPTALKRAVDELTPEALKPWLDLSQRVPFLPGQVYEQYQLIKAFFENGSQAVTEQMLRKDDIYRQSRLSGKLIVYIPDDPQHPLKEYDSFSDFMNALISQLRSTEYQAFFSRFVAQKDKGVFFARVNERLKTFTWQQREPLDMGPWWRETAIENPNAEPVTNIIAGDLWNTLYRERLAKAIADARRIAVPTGDEDATTRFKRLTSYLDIGWNVFNFAAMLVPGLGEAMLGVMVAQMLAEVVEGIEDWSLGDREQASAHFTGVLLNFAQLTLMGAGHVLPKGAVTPLTRSPLIDSLKPVEVNGKERLWRPDLGPYEQPTILPADAQADAIGVYQHEGRALLLLDDKHYGVTQDPNTGEHRLVHPRRPQAYQPRLEHNGAGSWKTELDRPLEWETRRLLRRLGPSVDGFSDETLMQIHTVSGVHEGVLRRMQVEHGTPPAALADTVRRFKAYADAQGCAERILAGQVSEEWAGFLPRFMTELRGWPDGKAIEVFERADFSGPSIKEGYVQASPAHTLRMTQEQLVAGILPERVVQFLDEQDLREVIGQWMSGDRRARVEALRTQLALQAQKRNRWIFDKLYSARERSANPLVNLLKRDYSALSTRMAEELLHPAEPADLQHMTEKKRVPLTMARRAEEAEQQVRLTRAYEGLYLEDIHNADTPRLALHSLETLAGWPVDVRIEIREYSFEGTLHDSIGPLDAPIRKVLIVGEGGQYQARDDLDQQLHGADNLYAAVLHALPDTQRAALGFGIHDATRLEKAVQAQPLAHHLLKPILLENPIRKPAYDPQIMRLRGGMQGYVQHTSDWPQLRRRLGSLYCLLSEEQIDTLLTEFSQGGGTAELRVRALETEFDQLNLTLRNWQSTPTVSNRFSPAGLLEWKSREQLCKVLRQCWQRTGPEGIPVPGVLRPQALILDNLPLNRHLASLPRLAANFDHVTRLSLRNADLLPGQERFLEPFRRVRLLNLEGNLLTRVPAVLSDMRFLTDLSLSLNKIQLDDVAVARLKTLTGLRSLGLRGNPLRLAPDISRMPRLQVLDLCATGIESWPVGLFSQPRPRNFFLDLRNNPIFAIPEVAPGSFRAELLARTWISREPTWMPADSLNTLRRYIESVGMDPERPYPPRGTLDSVNWAQGMSEPQWQVRQEVWDVVEDEFHSEAFFNLIWRLTQSADFQAGGTYRLDLTAKVWRMLEAMAENSELRAKLFSEAITPTECVDGGTQLFNAMGVQVLLHEAYGLLRKDLVELHLIELARGKSRLDELGAIARQRVATRLAAGEQFRRLDAEGNVTGTIDEVEVHLAYMTDLAERLDLPWQARGMQFRKIAGVTKEMIDAAFERVMALEEGDLLRKQILKQSFWKDWLEASYTEDLNTFKRRIDATTELQDALQRRAEGAELPAAQKARLEAEISTLAQELGQQPDEFADGRSMSDDQYVQALNLIDEQMKALMSTLTQRAIDRAGLQRVEIPFTIDPDFSM
ncbi:NEL-type E3 ubiquitin ligase domain-containing protein [Pseudomonas sp. 6D_7.1_Bac1]|uniref:NEL-type E3 ubiquitin ligase domain-containing protein n=1 Tax=Pseudomonas sp. 6D_7.1_Bac1 TaxID=2971615 RepID=UPI0021CAD561|nr:NEL-type E3 ubiquitin ligase domain-containing protein [Pseudomonas sp. 6D_7.1_Bac1]MCU1749135.1 hypothetical protein [Pseudomonas sp. 6D_7.1_Bac1]